MKVISHLAGLSATATLLLQVGTFVEASPFFTESASVSHSNDANIADQCQGIYIYIFIYLFNIYTSNNLY